MSTTTLGPNKFKQMIRAGLEKQVRPSLAALKTRGDLSVLAVVMRGALGLRYRTAANLEHLQAAMDWLCRAQDATPDDGVSAFFDVAAGSWAPSYPETTGYIIPTFFDYAAYTGNETYRARAMRMAVWLLTLQLENGAFPMGPLWPDLAQERKPIVFDTGQIIHGLVRTFEETGDLRYLEAAQRAGDWLVSILEPDGSWRRFDFLDHVHVYNARVAWALLRIDEASHADKYRSAAVKNLTWTMQQQTADGWFQHAAFAPDQEPLTHTLAYTIRGLLESGTLLSDQQMIGAARLAADALRDRQIQDGYLRGTYSPGWQSGVKWSCLTGNVQMAGIWLRFYRMTGHEAYFQAASAANHYVKQVQQRASGLPGLDGGIAGSFPIYGDYHPYLYVNWAAKFFIDSLLMEEQIQRGKNREKEG